MPRVKLDRAARHRVVEAALRSESQRAIAEREGIGVNHVGALKREALAEAPHYRRVLEILYGGAENG